jgi:hypothetical protein
VAEYRIEGRNGERRFSADYTIRNTSNAPVRYQIAFAFLDGDGLATEPKWVTRTVKAGHSYDGTVWVPWEKDQGSSGVKIVKVHTTPIRGMHGPTNHL